jgi:uncharacterized membrane protein YraQ (UPF0718 family)/copper chaperone CopZ
MLTTSWNIILELAPWLLLGMIIAGLLHGLLPKDFSKKQLRGNSGVLKAVGLGVPLPLCSCGVIPAGLGLKKDGASDGASMAFLISTPQTGVDSILVASSFLGWPFAFFKLGSAAAMGLAGGWITQFFGGSSPEIEEEPAAHGSETRSLTDMIAHGLDLIRTIWGWLLFGILASAAITLYVPNAVFEGIEAQGTIVACFAVLVISLPLYVCATASVPMAAAMVAGGMPPGAALVFLMAGPASNMATIGAVYKGFGGRNLAIYLGTIGFGSMGLALAFEQLIDPASVRTALTAAGMNGMHHSAGLAMTHGSTWWEFASGIVLVGLLLFFAFEDTLRMFRRNKMQSSTESRIVFPVGGMTCGGCSGRVEKALLALDGVQSVVVDLEPGQATVVGSAAESALKEAVTGIGFTVG